MDDLLSMFSYPSSDEENGTQDSNTSSLRLNPDSREAHAEMSSGVLAVSSSDALNPLGEVGSVHCNDGVHNPLGDTTNTGSDRNSAKFSADWSAVEISKRPRLDTALVKLQQHGLILKL